jgi:hypothetical protein
MGAITVCEECGKRIDPNSPDLLDGEFDLPLSDGYTLSGSIFSKTTEGKVFRTESDICFDCWLGMAGLQRKPIDGAHTAPEPQPDGPTLADLAARLKAVERKLKNQGKCSDYDAACPHCDETTEFSESEYRAKGFSCRACGGKVKIESMTLVKG